MLVPSQPLCEVGEGQGEKEKQEKFGAARLVLRELGKTAPGRKAAVGCGFCICPRSWGGVRLADSLPFLPGCSLFPGQF